MRPSDPRDAFPRIAGLLQPSGAGRTCADGAVVAQLEVFTLHEGRECFLGRFEARLRVLLELIDKCRHELGNAVGRRGSRRDKLRRIGADMQHVKVRVEAASDRQGRQQTGFVTLDAGDRHENSLDHRDDLFVCRRAGFRTLFRASRPPKH
jgi:hypothetical protein